MRVPAMGIRHSVSNTGFVEDGIDVSLPACDLDQEGFLL